MTTPDGKTLSIAEEQLKAANVSTYWEPWRRTLQVVITWHDDGRIGSPQIDAENDELVVSLRKPVEEDLLARMNRESAKLFRVEEEEECCV